MVYIRSIDVLIRSCVEVPYMIRYMVICSLFEQLKAAQNEILFT